MSQKLVGKGGHKEEKMEKDRPQQIGYIKIKQDIYLKAKYINNGIMPTPKKYFAFSDIFNS